MEKETKKVEWVEDFSDRVLNYYNLEQEPLSLYISLKGLRKAYPKYSTKRKKTVRANIRNLVRNSYKLQAFATKGEESLSNLKVETCEEVEYLIENWDLIHYYGKEDWYGIIERNNLTKDFKFENYTKCEGGGWTSKTIKITHIPQGICYY